MKREVEVTIVVEVEVDEAKFTPQFMEEFRASMFPFYDLDDHIKHIAQLQAREILRKDFEEGYGPLKDFGIKAAVTDQAEYVIPHR